MADRNVLWTYATLKVRLWREHGIDENFTQEDLAGFTSLADEELAILDTIRLNHIGIELMDIEYTSEVVSGTVTYSPDSTIPKFEKS